MKRIISILLAVLFAVTLLVSCSGDNKCKKCGTPLDNYCEDCNNGAHEFTYYDPAKYTDCELCGKEDVRCEEIVYQGESGWFCDDCYDTVIELLEYADEYY